MPKVKAIVDVNILKNLAARMLPVKEIASILNVRPSQLGGKYKEIIQEGYERGKANIRFKQFEAVEKGNVIMLIWMGKQYLGQRDVSVTDAKITTFNRKVVIDFAKLAQGDRPDPDRRGLALQPGEPMPQIAALLPPSKAVIA